MTEGRICRRSFPIKFVTIPPQVASPLVLNRFRRWYGDNSVCLVDFFARVRRVGRKLRIWDPCVAILKVLCNAICWADDSRTTIALAPSDAEPQMRILLTFGFALSLSMRQSMDPWMNGSMASLCLWLHEPLNTWAHGPMDKCILGCTIE